MAAERMIFLLAALSLVAAAPARALSPDAERALDDGLRHLYALEYPQARAAFHGLIEKEPGNPFGYLFESGAIWWEASQEYGLFKDTPTLQGLFERDVDAAIRAAQPWIDSKSPAAQADGNFAAGMALGTRGQWHIMRGHHVRAYLDGKHALKHLRKTIKLDPSYEDAYLGLGVYDYEAAHFSGVAKIGSFFGMRGDEKRGLEELRRAADKSKYSKRQALEFLASIYIIDKRDWAAALPFVERLRSDAPDSAYFLALELTLRWRLGDKDRSLALGRQLFELARSDPRAYQSKLQTLTCGFADQLCLDRDQAAGIRGWLVTAIEATPEAGNVPYLTLLHLYRGYMADVLGRNDEATSEYEWVLKHPDFSDSRARAKACLDTGCPARELLSYLRAQSKLPSENAVSR
jgi:hypothetical protein